MGLEIKHKKLNHEWDKLLSPGQKELIIKPGFGLSRIFPYMNAEDVKVCMDQIEAVIKNIEIMMNEKYKS